ncbi:MAG: hypothetical protein ACE5I5_12310 [Candidatus Heimdallarchaeota archaeon]
MTQQINLNELEKKAYRSMFQDGLWDIFLGLMITGSALHPLLLDIGIPKPLNLFLMPLIAILIFYTGKKFITIPRMGQVKFGPKRQAAQKKLRIAVIFIVLVTWIILILAISRFSDIGPLEGLTGHLFIVILIILIITAPLCVVAYFLDFDRLYVYAVLFGMAFPFAELLYPYVGSPLQWVIPFGIIGGIGVVTGLVYLIQFVRKYPKIDFSDYHSQTTEGFDEAR